MRKKLAAAAAFLLAAVMLIGGCGKKVTVRSLLEDVQKKTESLGAMKSSVQFSTELERYAPFYYGQATLTADVDIEQTANPAASRIQGGMHQSGTVPEEGLDIDSYTVVECGRTVCYMKRMDQWVKQELGYDKEKMSLLDTSAGDLLTCVDDLKIDRMDKDANTGRPIYIITGTVEGTAVRDLMQSYHAVRDILEDSPGESFDDSYYSDLKIDIEYAVDKWKKLPLYLDMKFSGLDSIYPDDIKLDDTSLHTDYKSFNKIDQINVPDDVIKNAQDLGPIDGSKAAETE